MADGYSRVTGNVGVCAVVPGPGLLNAAAGLATAYACGSRVLCLVGQVPAGDLGRGRGVLHELPDQHAVLNGVIGRSAHATSPDDIPGLLDAVFTALLGNERPRPHALQVGWDTMLRSTSAAWSARPELSEAKRPDLALVQAAADRLSRSAPRPRRRRRCARRRESIATLAERLGAPVVMTTEGKGALPASHPLALPMLAAPVLFDEADVVLVIGSPRASLTRTSSRPSGRRHHPCRRRSGRARPERRTDHRDRVRCCRSGGVVVRRHRCRIRAVARRSSLSARPRLWPSGRS